MFLELFYGLREAGVHVGTQEWQALMTALEKGLHGDSLVRFYYLARACLVKSEAFFDAFDRVFAKLFRGVEGSLDITDELLQWLRDPKNFKELTRGAARDARAPLARRADAALPRDPRQAGRAATTAAGAGSAPAATRPSATAASTRPASASAAPARAAPR